MQIEIKTSNELNIDDWQSYTDSFNQVFSKSFDVNHFKNKYLNTIDNFSYHALLKNQNLVVGGFAIIPYEYYINNTIIRVGLTVDVFVKDNFRSDLMALYKMYKSIKEELVRRNIALVITNPNDAAYLYWKKLVKFNDVGNLNYYTLPIKISNVVPKLPKVLNPFSILISKILLIFSYTLAFNQKILPIRLNRANSITEKQRYTDQHKKIFIKNAFFSYRIVNESGIITCYLIDFYNINKRLKDSYSLNKAISHIITLHKIDIIIFVGKISFFQILLFKLPFKLEPRHLHFMVDIIDKDKIKDPELAYNFQNWDFGLFNYDVR